jgi:hypothetical protein
LSPVVTDEFGRTVAVHPDTQIVRPMLAWLTAGLTAPGVRAEFGRTAPAPLTVIPPAGRAGTGPAVTANFGGAVVGGRHTEALVGALGLSVTALVERCAGVATLLPETAPVPAQLPVRKTSRQATDRKAMPRGLQRYLVTSIPFVHVRR